MRRAFLIFLILLFPLNVLALSWSVATEPAAGSTHTATNTATHVATTAAPDDGATDSFFARLFDVDTTLDLDPDEPPAMDLHDIVNHEAGQQCITLPSRAASCHDARRQYLSIPPPVRPPRAV